MEMNPLLCPQRMPNQCLICTMRNRLRDSGYAVAVNLYDLCLMLLSGRMAVFLVSSLSHRVIGHSQGSVNLTWYTPPPPLSLMAKSKLAQFKVEVAHMQKLGQPHWATEQPQVQALKRLVLRFLRQDQILVSGRFCLSVCECSLQAVSSENDSAEHVKLKGL